MTQQYSFLFEGLLDNISSDDMHRNSAETIADVSDEWFGRDEDWTVYFEFKTESDNIILNDGSIIRRLWDQFMEVASHLSFIDRMFTLIFNFEWENKDWANENFTIESVENTTEQKFNERLEPFIQKIQEYKDTGITVFIDVELKFENTSKIKFKKFCKELELIFHTFMFEYRNDKLIEPNWIEFVSNRMNNESSDRFGKTDNGNMFSARQMQSIYKRIFGREPEDETSGDYYSEIGKFGHMYRSIQKLANYQNLNGFCIKDVSIFLNKEYYTFLFIKLDVVENKETATTSDVFDFWKRYIEKTFTEPDIKALIQLAKSCNGYYQEETKIRTLFLVPQNIILNSDKFTFEGTPRVIHHAFKRGIDVKVFFEVRFVDYDYSNNLVYYNDKGEKSELIGHSKSQVDSQAEVFRNNHEKYFKRKPTD